MCYYTDLPLFEDEIDKGVNLGEYCTFVIYLFMKMEKATFTQYLLWKELDIFQEAQVITEEWGFRSLELTIC